ncbi:MAG: uL30 family ribosomal protein [Muribaculaceae bacterium]|nr:uL30 family ribosomal protein [Muribaculaceae bacterium]
MTRQCSLQERKVLRTLGLGHVGMSKVLDNTAALRFMLAKVPFAVRKNCR